MVFYRTPTRRALSGCPYSIQIRSWLGDEFYMARCVRFIWSFFHFHGLCNPHW